MKEEKKYICPMHAEIVQDEPGYCTICGMGLVEKRDAKHDIRKHNQHSHSMPSMKKASFEVALKDKKQIAERTMAFIFEKPKGFSFKAGQHIRMTLINPPETDSKGNSRFFSLASTPSEKDLLIAIRMRDTAFKRVLKDLQIGDKILIQILLDVPHRAFALHEDASKPAVYLAGGIGIVPAYSMIKDAIERKLPHKIFLFYSNRRPEDAPYLEELQNLTKQNPSFKLIATMTEAEKSTKSWQGETGYIDNAMLTKYVDDLKSPIYYISGLTEMVAAMKKLLKDSGVNEDNIRAEEFSGFKMGFINLIANPKSKSHLLFLAIVFMIIVAVVVHAAAAISIRNSNLGASLLNNPISYVMLGLLLVVSFKLKHLSGFMHRKKK